MMKSSVRRVDNSLAQKSNTSLESSNRVIAPKTRRSEGLTVTSETTLGFDPRIALSWSVEPWYWGEGYRLLGFHSTSEFSRDQPAKDLSAHGQMFLEETADGSMEEQLAEGTHYYTFLLHKKGLIFEAMSSPVRFSALIPSAKTGIGRVEDTLRVQQLKEDVALHGIKSEIVRNEAELALRRSKKKLAASREQESKKETSLEEEVRRSVEPDVRQVLKKALKRIELMKVRGQVKEQLRNTPEWKNLSPDEQQQLLNSVTDDLDPNEASFDVQ
jgi:hypothetical protein